MPENQQQMEELTSFKARTHHGSGQKERYDLKACVYLEDARSRDDRGMEVPRDMKLSVLRWDYPDGSHFKDSQWSDDVRRPHHSSNARDRKDTPAGGGDRVEADEVEGSPHSGRSDHDQFPGGPRRSMREDMWMLCNLDENLLFSQFHLPPTAAEPTTSSQDSKLDGKYSSSHRNNGQSSTASDALMVGVSDPTGTSSGGTPDGWRGDPNEMAPTPPTATQPVKRSRREERVTFHARPTCHDFLGGWARGRAGAGASPTQSPEPDSDPALEEEIAGNGSSLQASEAVGTGGRGGQRGTADRSSRRLQEPRNTRNGGHAGDVSGRRKAGGPASEKAQTRTAAGGGAGGSGRRDNEDVTRMVAVGFKSGECAVVDATTKYSPSIVSVLNRGGAYCQGRVTAVRFVPSAGRRLLVAAFSTGDAYTLDIALTKEAPLGPAGERTASGSPDGIASATGGGGSGGSNGRVGAGGSGGGSSGVKGPGRRGAHSRGVGGAAYSHAKAGGEDDGVNVATVNLASPTAMSSSSGVGAGSSRGSGLDRGFFVVRNSVAGANPVSRWRVTTDGRDITEMAFAPCEVDGRRLIALAALDGALRVVDYDEQALVAGFRSWFGGLLCLDWSPDGRYIVTGGEDDAVTLWCLETRTCVFRGEGHSSWVTGVVFDFWTSRQPYYRFTSVGEDARLCMWEHDELAGSLLHGGGRGRLRPAPSSKMQQRYKSSESLSDKGGEMDKGMPGGGVTATTASAQAISGLVAAARALHSPEGHERVSASPVVESLLANAAATARAQGTTGSQSTLDHRAATISRVRPVPDVSTAGTAAGSGGIGIGGSGGGRRPLSKPSRGVAFFSGYGRKDVGGEAPGGAAGAGGVPSGGIGGRGGLNKRGFRSINNSSNSMGGGDGAVGVALEEETDERGRQRGGHTDLVSPPLCRQSVTRAEPLCCKKLASSPLSQVTVVRSGVVTLCSEGLLKLWARPRVPPPLPPLGADSLHRHSPSFASRGKDDGSGYVIGEALDDHHEEVDAASPSLPSSRKTGPSAASSAITAAESTAEVDDGTDSATMNPDGASGSDSAAEYSATPAIQQQKRESAHKGKGKVSTSSSSNSNNTDGASHDRSEGDSNSSPPMASTAATFDALINTEIVTPRADGGGPGVSTGDGHAANGESNAASVKKKGFSVKRFFVSAEKSPNGRSTYGVSSGSGVGGSAGGRYSDDSPANALANAGRKARDPAEMMGAASNSSNKKSSGPSGGEISSGHGSGGGNNNPGGSAGAGGGKEGAWTKRAGGVRATGDSGRGGAETVPSTGGSRSTRSTLSNAENRDNRGAYSYSAGHGGTDSGRDESCSNSASGSSTSVPVGGVGSVTSSKRTPGGGNSLARGSSRERSKERSARRAS